MSWPWEKEALRLFPSAACSPCQRCLRCRRHRPRLQRGPWFHGCITQPSLFIGSSFKLKAPNLAVKRSSLPRGKKVINYFKWRRSFFQQASANDKSALKISKRRRVLFGETYLPNPGATFALCMHAVHYNLWDKCFVLVFLNNSSIYYTIVQKVALTLGD